MPTLNWKDRVQETSTTTGLGNLTLDGAELGYQTFVAAGITECVYCAEAIDGAGTPTGDWEVGQGTISGGTTLVRNSVRASSNAGALVPFTAGNKRVMLVMDAKASASPFTRDNKSMVALVTVGDGDQATATALTHTPAFQGYVRVIVSQVPVQIGDGTKVGVPAYFSGDGGTTARAIADLQAGDTLHWNGSVATYQLTAADRIDFDYVAQG